MNLSILPIRETILKKCLALFVCLSVLTAAAQTPISLTTWTGQGTSAAGPSAFTSLPATVVPGSAVVNVSQWNRDGSLSNTTAGGCYNSAGWTLAGSLATAIAANTDVYFTITNDAATELQVTEIYIMSQVSATGPQNVQMRYSVGSTSNNFGPTIATAHTASAENWTLTDNMCIGAGQTATFRLYAWGGSNPAGTLRINNGTSITAKFAGAITSAPSNSSPVCPGGVINFTGAFSGGIGPYTFNWAGPGSFASTLQHPTLSPALVSSAGTYTFTVTDALGCIPSSGNTTVVTITPPPPAISGSLSVCLGSTSALSNTTTGGTWASSDISVASVGLATGVVLGNNLGTATITYTAPTGCYTTSVVTVNPVPSAITGTLSTCVGTNITLSDVTPAGTWSSTSANVTVDASSGAVSGVTPGTAVVSYTLATGCYATAIVTVTSVPAPITGPSVVCVNAQIALANAVGGGTWASSDVSKATAAVASGIITGQSAGTTTITYKIGPGCEATTVITVNPIPNVITGTAVVCQASTTSLANTTPGGTWSSGSPFIATIGAVSGVATGVTGGTSVITYQLTATGCFRTRIVTVNPLPANITGPSLVCFGSSVTLTSATGGGTWSSSATATASVTSSGGVVTGNVLGVATITYTLSTGCFITRSISVEPLPAPITGPLEVCAAGSTITLSDATSGGVWTSSNPATASVGLASGVVTGGVPGTVSITYTLPTGCWATRGVTVNGIPSSAITALGDTMLCPGGFVVLTAITGTGYSYQWYEGGVPLPGATAATQTATTAGSYKVEIVNPLGCSMLSIPMTVSVHPSTAHITAAGSLTICSGSFVTLDANTGPGLTYQWLTGIPAAAVPGATSSSYNASSVGNVKVIVSNPTGCSEADSVNITVNPLPYTVTSASGPLVFCQGGSVILSATSVPGYAFQWFRGGIPIPGETNVNLAASLSGSYYVTVTNAYGCSASSSVTVVTVNPLPDVTVSHLTPSVFCPGGSVTLTAALGAGFTYQWYKGGFPISGATNYNYVASVTGGYKVKVVNPANGCFTTTGADTVVTVLSSATIVPVTPEEFCWGGDAILSTTASGLPYVSFQWYLNGSPIPGANSSTYTATGTGSYSCRIVPPGGCTVTTMTQPVIEHPLPNPVITYNAISGMMSTQTYFVAYQWYKGVILLSGATTPHTYAIGNGDYKVQVTDTNGCQSMSTVYPLKDWKGPNAVSNVQDGGIRIYPNPTTSIVHIESHQPIRVVITSVDGKVLADLFESDIDVSHLSNGVYFINVYNREGQRIATQKAVKMQ